MFGQDRKKWKFTCPKCGRIQSTKEFLAHKGKGVKPDDAYLKCASRFDAMDAGIDARCNYVTEGIGSISPVIVKVNGSRRIRVFDFAHAEN
uniref:Uncharacterized protein n=1 Tax=Candidatus Kentrum sp. FW TaxID=2126338 RepID=A0A450TW31_9GAMM|nr:MAG: hypothetical protein BECKFW1821C_GA0114237_10477 [Candidatus Kentron sp. FW]